MSFYRYSWINYSSSDSDSDSETDNKENIIIKPQPKSILKKEKDHNTPKQLPQKRVVLIIRWEDSSSDDEDDRPGFTFGNNIIYETYSASEYDRSYKYSIY